MEESGNYREMGQVSVLEQISGVFSRQKPNPYEKDKIVLAISSLSYSIQSLYLYALQDLIFSWLFPFRLHVEFP